MFMDCFPTFLTEASSAPEEEYELPLRRYAVSAHVCGLLAVKLVAEASCTLEEPHDLAAGACAASAYVVDSLWSIMTEANSILKQ